MDAPFDPAAFAQRQLDAYNAKDLARFVAEYREDVQVFRLGEGEPLLSGKAALAAHYRQNRFALAHLHAELLGRMVLGDKVIDHERVHSSGNPVSEVVAIYEVTPQGIAKVWFVRPA